MECMLTSRSRWVDFSETDFGIVTHSYPKSRIKGCIAMYVKNEEQGERLDNEKLGWKIKWRSALNTAGAGYHAFEFHHRGFLIAAKLRYVPR